MNSIQNSIISWKDHTPFSDRFEDYYYNSDGGVKESLHVFVNSHAIPSRAHTNQRSLFCINETGFGTGLNFYCTLQTIQAARHNLERTTLHFFSTELFPLSLQDFIKTTKLFPQFSNITSQIILQYPPAIKGFHRIILDGGQIYLTLIIDDSLAAYRRCWHKADAWYLDGFSPAKNSSMWQPELFTQIARLSSKQQTTLATFSAAGVVRRGLQEQGFIIKKHPGFGKKREMITGIFDADKPIPKPDKHWFDYNSSALVTKHVAIIGGGLSSCTTAEALARRGVKVTIFESADDICQFASGNLQGALYAKLPSKPTLSGEFHLTGLEYSLRVLTIHQCFDGKTAEQCGVLQLATNSKEESQHQDLLQQDVYSSDVVRWVNAIEASELAGTYTPFSGLFFPRAGWVDPKAFCEKLITSSNITLKLRANVSSIEQLADQHWQLHTSDGQTFEFDAVILANANSAKQFAQLDQTPTKAIRGQVTHAPEKKQQLNTVVCGAGYICPSQQGTFCFGASFNLQDSEEELTAKDQQANIAKLNKVLPDLAASLETTDVLTGKVAQRCSTPDYLPMVGPAPIRDQYITQYQKLNKDKNWQFESAPAPNYSGLYINIGHGSKGLITCPLSAEHLASIITNQPSPLPKDLSNALHPARFIIKQLIRRAI